MSWAPGQPVLTETDKAEWLAWRKDRKRQQQRARRARNPRIDYYPSPEALGLIESMWRPRAGHDVSSVINRVVAEWAEIRHRSYDTPERQTLPGPSMPLALAKR